MRKSGILLPVSSIPSEYGIGCFSKEAYEFVDFLKEAGQKLWQILPLGPTGYGDSPYQSFSTYAGNPYFIDLEDLIARGWITKEDCSAEDFTENEQYIDYGKLYLTRFPVLKKAYKNSGILDDKDFMEYTEKNAFWLDDYSQYMAIKDSFGGKSWLEWPMEIKLRKEAAIDEYKEKLKEEIVFYQFIQYLFSIQWKKLKDYANRADILIVGDIPIYVALDSADTWANPELFQLSKDGTPKAVAGCPPDSFSATGQLWGNPLYKWKAHKKTDYAWWIKRMEYSFRLYDIVRIDHFRGFDEYYSIPFGDKTAEFGHWEKGPGYKVFKAVKRALGDRQVIAEDLGYLTESVIQLVKKTGYPGMKILQFAFDSREESDYLPHNYTKNCVVYTGTHDNDTTASWYHKIIDQDRNFADRYLFVTSKEDIHLQFIRAALASVADTAIIPMQDYLGLKEEARINTPSTLGENWKWRLKKGQCNKKTAEVMNKMSKLYGR